MHLDLLLSGHTHPSRILSATCICVYAWVQARILVQRYFSVYIYETYACPARVCASERASERACVRECASVRPSCQVGVVDRFQLFWLPSALSGVHALERFAHLRVRSVKNVIELLLLPLFRRQLRHVPRTL